MKGLEERIENVIELADLMQTYFSGQNSGLIDPKLMDGLYVLIRMIQHNHEDELFHLDRHDFQQLTRMLSELRDAHRKYVIQAQIAADKVARMARRAQCRTRSNDQVRQELAGISGKIERLVDGEELPSLSDLLKRPVKPL